MGNRSTQSGRRGVARTQVLLPGVLVAADVCIPRAHPHAVWLLPWVEALLQGRSWHQVMAAPPWPAARDALVERRLRHTLFDLGWVAPCWNGNDVQVSAALREAFQAGGRTGLAKVLFDADVVPGEWWAEGLGGTMLSRQTAAQFDWDFKRRPDEKLLAPQTAQVLIDQAEPDLFDLVRKLGGVEQLWNARERAFLGSPLTAGQPKAILFTLYGNDLRLLPDELAELEPVLLAHAPHLFGQKKARQSRIVRLPRSPVELLAAEVERLPADPVELGPVESARSRLERLSTIVDEQGPELETWIDEGHQVQPVLGPTQRHFDALAEMCSELRAGRKAVVLVTSAFLNARNASETDGLAAALAEAPGDTSFLIVYGHANDDLPQRQAQDCKAWLQALLGANPSLAGRVEVVSGERRSHEKVILTSVGHWLVGSWNPASSRPRAKVFEASLSGRSARFAGDLLQRLDDNIEGAPARKLVDRLRAGLLVPEEAKAPNASTHRERLAQSVDLLLGALSMPDQARGEAWRSSMRALLAAFAPFRMSARLEVFDQHQTRDAFLAHLGAARRDVLLASDRLADSALDPATTRDLRGAGKSKRVVRVVWGREWASHAAHGSQSKEQLKRGRRTIRDARELLGDWLCTSEEPMENHAKLLVVDGMRGMVTSENLLSYGGEKGRYESRELGVAFWSPTVARHILGRFLLQWPGPLSAPATRRSEPPLDWILAGIEAWWGLEGIADELDFDWQSPTFIAATVQDELTRGGEVMADHQAAWDDLVRRAGPSPFDWVCSEGERLGLLSAGVPGKWRPAGAVGDDVEATLTEARGAVERPHPADLSVPERDAEINEVAPLVQRFLDGMVEIPAGVFQMGDDRVRKENPRHWVKISRPFLMGRTPVTQDQWEAVMGRLPHLRDAERHPQFPIIQVGYNDMQRFLKRLNAMSGGGGFDLPTEAQWEYACLGGVDTIYCFGDEPGQGRSSGTLEKYAWSKRSSGAQLQRVGQLLPNGFGLHDMHGLVYETMRDGFRRYTRERIADPIGPMDGTPIVARGGFWGRCPVDQRRPENEHFRAASRQTHEKSHRVSLRLICRLESV